jgi:hypothetical protein
MLTLEVALDSYSYRGVEKAPYYQKSNLWHHGLEEKIYPDVPELVGLNRFIKEISRLVKQAKAAR